MFLRSLSIENFRSMRRAELDFDDITLLIGENDSGKSSLFEALDQALAGGDRGPQFQAEHFHRGQGGPTAAPVGPICIELTFEERQVGEWNRIDLGVLKPLLKTDIRRPRRLVLRLTAAPPPFSATSPVIIVSQEGGIAGIQQSWEIYPDGAVVSGGAEVCRVADSVISSILSSSSETGFFTTSYTSPPAICCDYFTFTLTLHSGERANTISISDGDSKAPQELRELLASVRQAVSCSY